MGQRLTTESFIEKAKSIHGDKYDYSKIIYKNTNFKVIIICPIHGEFMQIPNDLQERQRLDAIKKSYALSNGYNFLEITYKQNIEEELNKYFNLIPI
jgi:hypothetical protein